MIWKTGEGVFDLTRPLFMGILNLTPDSFSDGGRNALPEAALARARHLVRRGALLLDLGAESTRPGASPVGETQEWERLEPVVDLLRRELPSVALSVDTRHLGVAARALERGVAVLNDVTGFRNPGMQHLARSSACGLIAMRSRLQGGELLMPEYTGGEDASADPALREMREIKDMLLEAGIQPQRLLLDPGFGFGTTYREDLALWEALPSLPEALDWPKERVCIGISRKRFVAMRAGQTALPPDQRDALTEAAHRELLASGYRVFRTHEVPEPTIRLAQAQDAPAVARVQVVSWRAAYRGILPENLLASLGTQDGETFCRGLILSPPTPRHRMWILERAAEVQGFAALGPCRDGDLDPARIAELYAIYLLPELWRMGHGRELLMDSIRHAQGQGFEAVALWVLERNARARKFYESLGWRQDGTHRTEWHEGYALRELRYCREVG